MAGYDEDPGTEKLNRQDAKTAKMEMKDSLAPLASWRFHPHFKLTESMTPPLFRLHHGGQTLTAYQASPS
ncbi:MAG TPA: hypothetical protein VL282_08250, partial [Tepidisphaeraceae bacterium]|nr:hypothetical protein [Tepidisphaeraceae bacterium]